MYLTYPEYLQMGGTLDNAAFLIAERKAEYLINAQAGGQTGARLVELTVLPQPVKACVFDLITLSANYDGERQIASESQSQGGASESIAYVTKTDAEIQAECESVIYNTFFGGGIGYLLYRGACM